MQVLVYRTSKFNLLNINKTLNIIFLENWTVKKKGGELLSSSFTAFFFFYLFTYFKRDAPSFSVQAVMQGQRWPKHPSTICMKYPFWFSSLTLNFVKRFVISSRLGSFVPLERLTEDIILLLMAKRKGGISSLFNTHSICCARHRNVRSEIMMIMWIVCRHLLICCSKSKCLPERFMFRDFYKTNK